MIHESVYEVSARRGAQSVCPVPYSVHGGGVFNLQCMVFDRLHVVELVGCVRVVVQGTECT